MQRIILIMALFLGGTALFAGEETRERVFFFPKTLFVEKIYTHPLGFRVDYRKTNGFPATVYLPVEWFSPKVGLAQIFYLTEPFLPCMTVYYDNETIDHIALYVHDNRGDPSWDALRSDKDFSQFFSESKPTVVY